MADQKLGNKSWNCEECVQEGAAHNAAPMLADESLVGGVAGSFGRSMPVPIGGISRDTEIDYVK